MIYGVAGVCSRQSKERTVACWLLTFYSSCEAAHQMDLTSPTPRLESPPRISSPLPAILLSSLPSFCPPLPLPLSPSLRLHRLAWQNIRLLSGDRSVQLSTSVPLDDHNIELVLKLLISESLKATTVYHTRLARQVFYMEGDCTVCMF